MKMKKGILLIAVISLLALAGSLHAQIIPPAPTNLVVQRDHDGEVHLYWQASMGMWNFKVYRSTGDSLHFAAIGTVGMMWFHDQTAVNGNTYYYYVTTIVVQGGTVTESSPSNIAWISLSGGGSRPQGTIAGRVTSDSTGVGIPFVRIRFYRLGGSGMMGENGAFTDSLGFYLALVDTGRYLIKAEPMGGQCWNSPYQPEWYNNAPDPSTATPVRVLQDSTFIANFGLASRGAISFAIVSGQVTDTLGVPVRNAVVAFMRPLQEMNNLYATSGMMPGMGSEMMEMEGVGHVQGMMWSGRTDSLGNYRARVVVGRSYIALASKVGYVPEYFDNKRNPLEADIILVRRDTTGIDFSLSPNPVYQNSVSGIVSDSLGTRAPSRVVLYPIQHMPGMQERFVHTDSLGSYTLNNVPPGRYFVFAAPFGGYAPAFYKAGAYGVRRWQDADTVYVAGNLTGIDIGVVRIGTSGYAHVGGHVHSSSGAPLNGVGVLANLTTGEIVGYGLTDATGSYALDAVATGTVTLTVGRTNFSASSGSVTVSTNTFTLDNVDFVLSPASPAAVGESGTAPVIYALQQNYPNPFNPSTTISFSLPTDSRVSLKIYNLLGQEVASLVNGDLGSGVQHVVWNGKDNASRSVASGLYIYKLAATPSGGGQVFTQARKMLLMK